MIVPYAAHDCAEAQKAIEEIMADPITQEMGESGMAVESYLRKHIKHCEKCMEDTEVGNMS